MAQNEIKNQIEIYEHAIKKLNEKIGKNHPDYSETCRTIEFFRQKIMELRKQL